MTTKSKVVPCEGYEFIVGDPFQAHPIDGIMAEEGSYWTEDAHTAMLLRDGVIKRVEDAEQRTTPSPGPDTMFKSTLPGTRG